VAVTCQGTKSCSDMRVGTGGIEAIKTNLTGKFLRVRSVSLGFPMVVVATFPRNDNGRGRQRDRIHSARRIVEILDVGGHLS
jgi:hypothetical protein